MGAITASTKKTYFENVLSKLPKPLISRWVAVFSFLLFATYCSRSIVFFLTPSTAGNNGTRGSFFFLYVTISRYLYTLWKASNEIQKVHKKKETHTFSLQIWIYDHSSWHLSRLSSDSDMHSLQILASIFVLTIFIAKSNAFLHSYRKNQCAWLSKTKPKVFTK